MATHDAVVTVAKRAPFEIHQVPTITPHEGQLRLKVQWAASTPFDLHVADGGLLVQHPRVMGSGFAGEVVELGPSVTDFKVGDRVFGYGIPRPGASTNGHQIYVTSPTYFLGKAPANISLEEAVTTVGSVITIFRAMKHDFGLELPWPVPENYIPPHAEDPILIWGGSGSVGLFAVQVFRHWGYKHILATASKRNHAILRELGATEVFDYNEPNVLEKIKAAAGSRGLPFIMDCIGHLEGTVKHIAKLAVRGSKVAIVLPVILRDATDTVEPEYAMDASEVVAWADGVEVKGIRAHSYDEDPQLKELAQTYIIPELLGNGAIKPLPYRVLEGKTLLERAENARQVLREKGVSGERLIWRVAE